MMKPEELIAHLEIVAGRPETAYVGLAVAFEFDNVTQFICADEKDKLATLKGMVERGGQPIGFLQATKWGDKNAVEVVIDTIFPHDPAAESHARTRLEPLKSEFLRYATRIRDATPKRGG
jgi:hypothetical protein